MADPVAEPETDQAIDKRTVNALITRLNTLQHDSQRQIDDLRERLRIVEEDLGLSARLKIDWEKYDSTR